MFDGRGLERYEVGRGGYGNIVLGVDRGLLCWGRMLGRWVNDRGMKMSIEKYEVEVFHKGLADYKEEKKSSLIVEPGTIVCHRNFIPDISFEGGNCKIGKEKRPIPPDGEAIEMTAEVRIVIRRRKEEVVEFGVETRLPWYRRLKVWSGYSD